MSVNVTPMMQQYLDMKEQYGDCILFFRLGDFYEMFFSDAELASRELEITLTGRDCGLPDRAPMCGVPFHSADSYIARLVSKGHKVAICEQTEDPSLAKGLVKREVIRVITPGTVTDSAMLDEKRNNYLLSAYRDGYYFGIAAVDLSTGEFCGTSITWGNTCGKIMDEIAKFSPSEIIANSAFINDAALCDTVRKRFSCYISPFGDEYYTDESVKAKLSGRMETESGVFYGKSGDGTGDGTGGDIMRNAAGALLEYLEQTQKVSLDHIRSLSVYRMEEYMVLDSSTRRNLELCETMREKSRKGSLLWVLDRTVTSMGGRMLRKWIEQPLLNVPDIEERLDAVSDFKERFMVRSEIRELLRRVYDMERLTGKIILGTVNCRDLIALKNSMGQLPYIKHLISNYTSGLTARLNGMIDPLPDIHELIERAVIEEPPVSVREGGFIKNGFDPDVDKLRLASTDGKKWIAEIEKAEREKTGIKNLKVGYNRVFGYYIEVTKSNLHMAPESYIRKQTLANCERYITQELKEIEDTVLGAEEKLIGLEYDLFCRLRQDIASQVARIKAAASGIAHIDTLCSLAEVADRENYCRPVVDTGDVINIKDGRHPVVERMLERNTFVPNDTCLDMENERLAIITGPNMAGKSTYMRQVALIALMAQTGSFVPASEARIGVADRIFTRVGASDDLSAGQSTFMVEMSEMAGILNNATPRSLLILDEIGRGTSTFDGLSIAWAVIEFISDAQRLGSRTLFATHYHELTELEGKLQGVKNYCISVKEKGDDIIFLRKIIRGGADDSYGIQVARLAGIPRAVIDRARDVLAQLEEADIGKKEIKRRRKMQMEGQVDLFSSGSRGIMSDESIEIIEELKSMDVSALTPLEAINAIYRMQQRLKLGGPVSERRM